MRIAIPLYDRFTALDAVGPYEVLQRLPGASVTWLAHEPGVVRTDTGMLGIEATAAFEDLPDPEIVLVPGGTGTNDFLEDERLVGWIRARARDLRVDHVGLHRLAAPRRGRACSTDSRPRRTGSTWTTSSATARGPTGRRVVEQGKVITAAGVSSGIDMGLVLAAKIAGPEVAQAIQLGIEYDPQPPFDSGSVEKAAPETVRADPRAWPPLVRENDGTGGLADSDRGPLHRAVRDAVHAGPGQCDAIAPGA